MFDTSAFMQGFVLGLGLFVCPGPKDVFILRQALLRYPAFELIAVGTLSDALLIWFGMAGASAVLSRAPALQNAALWLGVCFMVVHGLLAAKRAISGISDVVAQVSSNFVLSRGKNLSALLAVSFLNPVVWLDTVLVIGAVGSASPQETQLSFALGAVAASFSWFLVIVTGAQSVRRWMTIPMTWRALDALVAVAMIGLAAYVLRDLV